MKLCVMKCLPRAQVGGMSSLLGGHTPQTLHGCEVQYAAFLNADVSLEALQRDGGVKSQYKYRKASPPES